MHDERQRAERRMQALGAFRAAKERIEQQRAVAGPAAIAAAAEVSKLERALVDARSRHATLVHEGISAGEHELARLEYDVRVAAPAWQNEMLGYIELLREDVRNAGGSLYDVAVAERTNAFMRESIAVREQLQGIHMRDVDEKTLLAESRTRLRSLAALAGQITFSTHRPALTSLGEPA